MSEQTTEPQEQNTEVKYEIRKVQTLLFCKGWKPEQINKLIDNALHRYNMLFCKYSFGLMILKRAYDYTAGGKSPSEVVDMFAPESESEGE